MARRPQEELQEIAAEVIEDVLAALDKSDVRDSVQSFGYQLTEDEVDAVRDEINHVELTMKFDDLR